MGQHHERRTPEDMPVPRIQLRWAPATKRERRKSWTLIPDVPGWACHYEIILPLQRGDIRRRNPYSESPETLVIPIGKTCTTGDAPTHAPFRDSTHSRLDADALGGLPVFLITADGRATQLEEVASVL